MPVHYDESVSGDLEASSGRIFVLDVGQNSIAGTMHFYSLASEGSEDNKIILDTDGYVIAIAPNNEISAARVDIEFTALNSNATDFVWYWILLQPATTQEIWTCFNLVANACPSASQGPLFWGYPLVGPQYNIRSSGAFTHNSRVDAGGSFAYVVTFTVTQVPEPTSVSLLLSGTLIVALRARAKSALRAVRQAQTRDTQIGGTRL